MALGTWDEDFDVGDETVHANSSENRIYEQYIDIVSEVQFQFLSLQGIDNYRTCPRA